MTRAQHRFLLVVALDRAEYAEIVLEHAVDQAARHDSTDLHFVTVLGPREDVDEARQWLTAFVREGLEPLGLGTDLRVRLHVIRGEVAEEVGALASDLRADLLLIGRFGTHEHKGSTADKVVSIAPCPTLVVGLTERTFDAPPQCPDCVEIRARSEGERWFCAAHTGSERMHFTALLPWSGGLL